MKKLLVVLLLVITTAAYADTETVTWYKDGSVYDTTTCQTGNDVVIPNTTPSKRGHTFNGWVFAYDFSTLDPSVDGTGWTYNSSNMTWETTFNYGTVLGKSLCSTTSGSYAVAGTPDESGIGETANCWCKATEYITNDSNIAYENLLSSAWVFRYYGSASDCASNCATFCASRLQGRSDFRRAVFGVTQ